MLESFHILIEIWKRCNCYEKIRCQNPVPASCPRKKVLSVNFSWYHGKWLPIRVNNSNRDGPNALTKYKATSYVCCCTARDVAKSCYYSSIGKLAKLKQVWLSSISVRILSDLCSAFANWKCSFCISNIWHSLFLDYHPWKFHATALAAIIKTDMGYPAKKRWLISWPEPMVMYLQRYLISCFYLLVCFPRGIW